MTIKLVIKEEVGFIYCFIREYENNSWLKRINGNYYSAFSNDQKNWQNSPNFWFLRLYSITSDSFTSQSSEFPFPNPHIFLFSSSWKSLEPILVWLAVTKSEWMCTSSLYLSHKIFVGFPTLFITIHGYTPRWSVYFQLNQRTQTNNQGKGYAD